MLKEPAARYCHDWEVAIVFVKKHGKLKMPTLLTSVQIHRRKYLENKLIVSIFYIELSFEINRLLKISLEKYTRRKLSCGMAQKTLTRLIRLTSCFSVRYQHQLRLFIECKIVVLRELSIDFLEQVILEALLSPNSNVQERFVTLSQTVFTQMVS